MNLIDAEIKEHGDEAENISETVYPYIVPVPANPNVKIPD